MNVTVQERRISFTSEYDIDAGTQTYYARKTILAFNDHLEIKNSQGALVATIQGFFSPIRERHEFLMADGRIYRFHLETIWKPTYDCEGNGEIYTVYQHKGRRCSVFVNDRQVAAFDKNKVVWGDGNRFDIQMDADADLMVILCIVLTINTTSYDDHQETVSIDFGNIGPEARPFNESWQPR